MQSHKFASGRTWRSREWSLMKSLLAGGAAASLLLLGAVTAAPAQADPPVTPTIQVSPPLTSSGSGDVKITGTYTCDPATTAPGIAITVTQPPDTGTVIQSARVTQKPCTGASQPFTVAMFGGDFVAGPASYTADLVDTGNSDMVLASDDADTTIDVPSPPPPPPAPGAVTGLKSVNRTPTSITILWSPPSQGGVLPDTYNVSVSPSKASSNTSSTGFTFNGLKPSTFYDLSVRAKDKGGVVGPVQTITRSTTALPKTPPPPKKRRRVSLNVTIFTTHHHVRPTHLDVIHGRVRPHHRVQIQLQRRVGGVWVDANNGVRRASATGAYHFEIRPVAKFVGRVIVVSTKKFKASHSKSVVIRILH
jgi:hypothetical protein